MFELFPVSVTERPEHCALTPAHARFANIHDVNSSANSDASLSWNNRSVS